MASYSNESFHPKKEWPILHPSSLCCTSLLVEGKRQTGSSHLNRILQYIQATCVVNISDEYFFRLECRLYYNINIETMPWRVKGIINCELENESSGIMSFLFHHPKAYYKFPMPSVLIHTIASCWEHPVVIFCFLEFFIGQCLLISIPTSVLMACGAAASCTTPHSLPFAQKIVYV